jgi:hypothetical protein
MNRGFCEREDQTSAAARSGVIDRETALHAQECAVCSEVVLVSKLLNEEAVHPDERIAIPDPTFIWQTARLRVNQEAIRLALRPIRYMKILALVAFACSPWLRLLLPIGRELAGSSARVMDSNLAFASRLWPTMASESTILLGSLGTIILLGLSSWYMLRQE